MIFFALNDGTIVKTMPTTVYQGSAGANDVYLIAPFAANTTVTVAFTLPDGIILLPAEMTQLNAIPGVETENGSTFSGWSYSLPNTITQKYGTVTMQFFFYNSNGNITATSSTAFVVSKGVPAVLPDAPTQDVYEQILSNIASLQEQLDNGSFASRSICAWSSEFIYGANELVYYPVGTYGAIVKSLVRDNTQEPYTGETINDQWQQVIDFDYVYSIASQAEQSVKVATSSAASAYQSAMLAQASQEAALLAQNNAENAQENAAALEFKAAQSAAEAENFAQQAQQIVDGIGSVYIPQGSIPFASLPAQPTEVQRGYVWNITDAFTTDDRFLEGAGQSVPAGANVACILNNSDYKYDVLSGIVDLSNYAKITGTYSNMGAGKDGSGNVISLTYSTKSELSSEIADRQAADSALSDRIDDIVDGTTAVAKATNADNATEAEHATSADNATYATTAGSATTADSATFATTAGTAQNTIGITATQIANEDLHNFLGSEYWGKTYYAAGGNTVVNKPAGVDGFVLEVIRAGLSTTIHRLTTSGDTSGESVSPNVYIEQYITSWTNWEEIATGDGKYMSMIVGKSETLTEPFAVGKDSTTATTGYVKFASVSLPNAYHSASARFEVLDKNPVNAQTPMCGVEVVVRSIGTAIVTVTVQLLYGSAAYLSKIYACAKTGSYPVNVDLYFDIKATNPQESVSCIKPLFTFGRTTVDVEFTFITDNVTVSALPTDTTNTQLSTVYTPITEAADSAKLNGKAASEYALADDLTAIGVRIDNVINGTTPVSRATYSDTSAQATLANTATTATTASKVDNNLNIFQDGVLLASYNGSELTVLDLPSGDGSTADKVSHAITATVNTTTVTFDGSSAVTIPTVFAPNSGGALSNWLRGGGSASAPVWDTLPIDGTSGTSLLSTAVNTRVITHGLGATPSEIFCQLYNPNNNGTNYYISEKNSTTFTVEFYSSGTGGAQSITGTLYWIALK